MRKKAVLFIVMMLLLCTACSDREKPSDTDNVSATPTETAMSASPTPTVEVVLTPELTPTVTPGVTEFKEKPEGYYLYSFSNGMETVFYDEEGHNVRALVNESGGMREILREFNEDGKMILRTEKLLGGSAPIEVETIERNGEDYVKSITTVDGVMTDGYEQTVTRDEQGRKATYSFSEYEDGEMVLKQEIVYSYSEDGSVQIQEGYDRVSQRKVDIVKTQHSDGVLVMEYMQAYEDGRWFCRTYRTDGQLLVYTTGIEEEPEQILEKYSYDEAGRIVEEYRDEGSMGLYETTYTYTENGCTSYCLVDKSRVEEGTYDSEGNLLSLVQKTMDGVIVSESYYNANGILLDEKVYNEDGSMWYKHTAHVTEERVIYTETYSAGVTNRSDYTYGSAGELLEERSYESEVGETELVLRQSRNRTYNEYGDVASEVVRYYDRKGEVTSETTETYEYKVAE